MTIKEEKNLWQLIAITMFVMIYGLTCFVMKQAKFEYSKNLRFNTRQYYQNGINQLNVQTNVRLSSKITEPIKIIIKK